MLAAPFSALADATAPYYERSFVLAADARCRLFDPASDHRPDRLDLAGARRRGPRGRHRRGPGPDRRARPHQRGRDACADPQLAMVRTRVSAAFNGWSRIAPHDLPRRPRRLDRQPQRLLQPDLAADADDPRRRLAGHLRLCRGRRRTPDPQGRGLLRRPVASLCGAGDDARHRARAPSVYDLGRRGLNAAGSCAPGLLRRRQPGRRHGAAAARERRKGRPGSSRPTPPTPWRNWIRASPSRWSSCSATAAWRARPSRRETSPPAAPSSPWVRSRASARVVGRVEVGVQRNDLRSAFGR
jgi:hypothetical protein